MKLIPTPEQYQAAFEAERQVEYPTVTAFEQRLGYAVSRARLEEAARVLACPVKAHPPNWQHGRVLYALAVYLLTNDGPAAPVTLLDIGTAKGFSALCLEWARRDVGADAHVISVDVIDPGSAVRRNTIADCERLQTLPELLAPWPEAQGIEFRHETGIDWLSRGNGRIRLAFVDGKHTRDVVQSEGRLLAKRQIPGDAVVFDDYQISGVADAIEALRDLYDFSMLSAKTEREYAIGARR